MERWNSLNLETNPRKVWITECREGRGTTTVAATAYVHAYSEHGRA